MKRSDDYWLKRAEANMDLVQAAADKRLQVIGRAMQEAQQQLTEDAQRIFRTFAGKFNLTDAEAKAALQEPLSRAEFDRLRARIATLPAGKARLALEIRANSGAYAYRISRAEALRDNIAIETARVSQVLEDELTGQLRFTATEGYSRRMFDLQRQTGDAFAVPDIGGMKVAVDAPWAGKNYSARIWGNRDRLAQELQETISSGFLSGKSNARVAREIRDRFGVAFRDAERLVRTETSYIAGQADLQAYKDLGIEEYEFITALDSRTCKHCAPLDGQVFYVRDARVGKNYPPIHPNCRCTTGMADERPATGQRRGKNANGKNVLLPADMNYAEWQDWQLAGAPENVKAWRNIILQRTESNSIISKTEAVSALNSDENHGIIDVEIDELTPCLRKLSTGEVVPTSVKGINPATYNLRDFRFDWNRPGRDGYKVYALFAKGDSRPQGLIALGNTGSDGGVWVELVESAIFNSRYNNQNQQEYSGVGGHLFAEAIRRARISNPNGYVYFQAKSNLVDYYAKAFGAELVVAKNRTMGIFDEAATKLVEKYYGGDGDE